EKGEQRRSALATTQEERRCPSMTTTVHSTIPPQGISTAETTFLEASGLSSDPHVGWLYSIPGVDPYSDSPDDDWPVSDQAADEVIRFAISAVVEQTYKRR